VEKYTTTVTQLGVYSNGMCGSAERSTCTVAHVETRFTESIQKITGESFEAGAHPDFSLRGGGGVMTVRLYILNLS